METRTRIHVTGVVQGVGFRPFVYNLARRHGLKGYCLNDSEGVVIEVEGSGVDRFMEELRASPPPLSRIETLRTEQPGREIFKDFSIRESLSEEGKFALISPDISVCQDCLSELFDPGDRRYLYPFINCTNCGPRYSIVKDIPYDRRHTTMAPFRLCGQCEREYHDPVDRRFHAQPNACPECGPRVWLSGGAKGPSGPSGEVNYAAIEKAQRLLKEGAILAIKGLGGFHLACDAERDDAVKRLRERKRRSKSASEASNKPFALMAPDIGTARSFASISEAERRLLEDRVHPIVILGKRLPGALSDAVAPRSSNYGVMLPYTPMHHLLFAGSAERFSALVMTSGNLADEPIVTSNEEAASRLSGIADCFLLHDRGIHMRVDDSIARVVGGRTRVLRRARGFTPEAVPVGEQMEEILAFGAQLKNTFCLTKGQSAILSQHIGDLESYEALSFFKESLENLKSTFRASPRILAHDMHPDYLSTKYASEYAARMNISADEMIPVQHHHAHIASCMAEHGIRTEVIGVAFDGTGYGTDGRIWGAEFLAATRREFSRLAHLEYMPLPGGEMAIREPWRMAASCLYHAYGKGLGALEGFTERMDPLELAAVTRMMERSVNSPLASSAGRLFDAVASLVGLRDAVTYEAEAAMELESVADAGACGSRAYGFELNGGEPMTIDARPVIRGVVDDLRAKLSPSVISGRFHGAVADMISTVCREIRDRTGIGQVVLSGGVFQNALLCRLAHERLSRDGFEVWQHERVPANDAGVSLGQAAVAWERILNWR